MYRKFLVAFLLVSILSAAESPTEEQLALMREYHLTVPPTILGKAPATASRLPDIANDRKIDVEFGPWDPVELPLPKNNPVATKVYEPLESVDDETFDKKIEHATGITIVDCWAAWCTPCARMAPGFESLSKEMSDLKFKKVNVETATIAANRMQAFSLPKVVIFDNGKIIASTTGYKPVDELRAWIRLNTRAADIVEIPGSVAIPTQAQATVSAEYSAEITTQYHPRVMARGAGRAK